MKSLFVSYELAVKLKQNGFDQPCLTWACSETDNNIKNVSSSGITNSDLRNENYHKSFVTIPTYQQVIRWFRVNHNIIVEARLCSYSISLWEENQDSNFKFRAKLFTWKDGETHYGDFDNPEEALNESIKQAFKKIKR